MSTNNIQQACEVNFSDFEQNDVHYIKNAAYVVKEPAEQEGGGKRVGVGCVVAWNDAFELLTNFLPRDVDEQSCFELIGGIKNENGHWVKICSGQCEFRIRAQKGEMQRAGALRDVWINSKDRLGGDIVRLVDIGIFPFKTEGDGFALHILFDKRERHGKKYFYDKIVKNKYQSLPESNLII